MDTENKNEKNLLIYLYWEKVSYEMFQLQKIISWTFPYWLYPPLPPFMKNKSFIFQVNTKNMEEVIVRKGSGQ